MTLQALVAKVTTTISLSLSSDSPGSLSLLPKSLNLLHNKTANLTCNATAAYSHMQLSRCHLFFHAYHYCQEPYRLYLPNLSYSNGSQVFQPCSVPWYLPKICSRISQICLCISVSNSLRWSRNIAMMSRWFAFRRTSSSNGKSHSKRTSKVCISRNTLVTFSKPIIQPMYCSSIASRNGRLSRRLSILSTDRMAIFSLFTDTWARQGLTSNLSKHITCVSRTYFNLSLSLKINLHTSLCVSPGKLLEFSLSKHLTCVSRTYSQPQPVEIFLMLISRQVVGVFTVQTPHLCLQDLLPTSACRDTPSISKHVIPGNQLTSHLQQMTLQPTCHKNEMRLKNTSPESRILKLFDALDFTTAAYQPSDHFRTLVQAQHRSLQKIQELNTNDLSFTLHGILSTLQRGSAENGVGSSVELRYHVEKAPCTDLRSDPTLPQNSYRTTQANAYVNHAHQTQAQSVNSQT